MASLTNQAPVLLDIPQIPAIDEDIEAASNLGVTLAELMAGLINDADDDLHGLAITGVDHHLGVWQYSTDGGTTWQTLEDDLSETNALVLGATSLYSHFAYPTPSAQNWLTLANVNFLAPTTLATETHDPSGVLLNTTTDSKIYAGYSSVIFSQTGPMLVNPAFPELDNKAGYQISFRLQLLEEAHTNPDRAGFSLIVVSQDTTKALELGFQKLTATTGQIFAQSQDPLFTAVPAETISFNTAEATSYTLAVKGDSYTLLANGQSILTGLLRDYSAFTSVFPVPDPYETPNFLFLGDDSTSAKGAFRLSQVAVETPTRLRFVPQANAYGSASLTLRAWDTTDGAYHGQTGVDATPLDETSAFSVDSKILTLTVNPVNDPPMGGLFLDGEPLVGQTLYAYPMIEDFDGLGEFTYEWQQSPNGETNWSPIAEANDDLLTLTQAQKDQFIRVVVTYIDGLNNLETVVSEPTFMAVAPNTPHDLTRDGVADILWMHRLTGATALWPMAEEARFESVPLPKMGVGWELRASGDFDHNHGPDLLWRHQTSGETMLWWMEGTHAVAGTLLDRTAHPSWALKAAADFDQDGYTDLLWRHTPTGRNEVWLMGDSHRKSIASLRGFYPPEISYQGTLALPTVADAAWDLGGVGNFIGDDTPEILWHHRTTGQTRLWQLDAEFSEAGWAIAETYTLPSLGAGWQMVGAADLTGDGHTDILWRHSRSGANALWEMDGLNLEQPIRLPSTSPLWTAVV